MVNVTAANRARRAKEVMEGRRGPDPLMTPAQVGEYLQLHPKSVRNLVDAGKLKAVLIPSATPGSIRKTMRIRLSSVEAMLMEFRGGHHDTDP